MGYITDFLSYCFLIGTALFWGTSQDLTGYDLSDSSINTQVTNRLYQTLLAQLLQPVAWLWMYGLAVGKGLTAEILSTYLFVDVLGPCSYGMFLFQQTIGQLYYATTRSGNIWIIPKHFIWFSPVPLAVDFGEFFAVITILILFCIYIFPRLTSLTMPLTMIMLSNIQNDEGPTAHALSSNATPDEIVNFCITVVTGVQVTDGMEEFSMFLGSMDAVLLVAEVNKNSPVPGILKLPDILKCKIVADLQQCIKDKLANHYELSQGRAMAGFFHSKGWKKSVLG